MGRLKFKGVAGKMNLRLAARVVVVLLLALSSSACAWLHEQERRAIYRPTQTPLGATAPVPAGGELYFLNDPAQIVPAHIAVWWLPSTQLQAPTLLYLHGTFRSLEGNLHKINALQQAGFNVLAVDYRGWGQSSAITPSQESIMADARLAWQELVRREPRPGQRVIYGHSMGSGIAVALASTLIYPADYGGLILESAFTSFTDVARAAGFWASVLALFTDERFDALGKIAQVQAPLLMLHGSADDTVPIALGERLFAAARTAKQWVRVEGGGHSDLDLVASAAYQRALQRFKTDALSSPTPASLAR